jgi:SP family xylose:H+ symportor-like MFS transporter
VSLPLSLPGIAPFLRAPPQLFSTLGSSTNQALLTHVIIGAVNVVTTLVAVFTVDSVGR